MAIETNKSLVQFGYAINKDASTTAGFITFDSGKQAIYVGDGSEAKLVTPSVKNVEFDTASKVLTITKLNGTTQTLDFSDVASAEGVNSLLATLRTDINKNASDINDVSTRVNNLDASYKAADASLQEAIDLKADASTAALKSDVSALSNKFDTSYGELTAADTSLRNDISALQQAVGTNGTVANMINNAINALDSSKASNGGNYVAVDVSIVDGKLAEVKVNDSSLSATVELAASAIHDCNLFNEDSEYLSVRIQSEDGYNTLVIDDSSLSSKLKYLSGVVAGGVHFRGVYEELPSTAEPGFSAGDIIIVANPDGMLEEPTKEYILVDTRDIGPQWVELGDLNPSTEAISALEKKHDEHVEAINAYKVNGKAISANPVLNGADIKLDNYTKNSSINDVNATDTINQAIGKLEAKADAAAVSGITSFGDKTGDIIFQDADVENGWVEFTLAEIADYEHQLNGKVFGLKSAAFTDATNYAIAAQGAKADTAIQGVTAETSTLNNTYYVAVHATEDETTHEVTLSSSIKVQDIESAGDNANGLAEASDVKAYVDSQITAAALTWIVL